MLKFVIIFNICILLTSCKGQVFNTSASSNSEAIHNLTVSWTANHERAVNQIGGGYKVYYSRTVNFDTAAADAYSVDVPYVSGPSTPVTARITNLIPGTYYIKVRAYSALISPNSLAPAQSEASSESSVTVP